MENGAYIHNFTIDFTNPDNIVTETQILKVNCKLPSNQCGYSKGSETWNLFHSSTRSVENNVLA
ncbi:hypothetical protein CK203_108027 [Vitis vinifera]|uniref:Uncharacterized protein n=1 Tax=Vitis vinifera TaxID=29760 RepID=A0A438D3B1_VITVI|nr:hypothetical protein CK203_108027 [Vitis vinifera]